MDSVSVKTMDLAGSQTVKGGQSSSKTSVVNDDFRKLLQSNQEKKQETTKETNDSKDAGSGAEKIEDVKENKPAMTDGDESKTETTETENKTDELAAAYQMSQNMRPEIFVQIVQGTVAENPAESILLIPTEEQTMFAEEVEIGVQMSTLEGAVQMPEELPKNGKTVKATDVPVDNRVGESEQKQFAAPVQQETENFAETAVAGKTEARQTVGKTEKSQQTVEIIDDQSVMSSHGTPQNSAHIQTLQEQPKEQVTVYVSQPKELPEKIGNQLLTKMVEGVRELEVQIEPQNLGKIAVKVLYSANQATISIICSEKKTMEMLGNHAREIGDMIDRNLGGTTTIIVEKQENDYLNQSRDGNNQSEQNEEQQKKQEKEQSQDTTEAGEFLQKLRLGLVN